MDCNFCRIVRKTLPAEIIYEDSISLAFLDIKPQTRGHLQLIPKEHYRWIYDVPQMGRLFSTAQTLIRVIIPLLGADHVSLATYGHMVAHAHIWIVPQYRQRDILSEFRGSHGNTGEISFLAAKLRTALSKEVA